MQLRDGHWMLPERLMVVCAFCLNEANHRRVFPSCHSDSGLVAHGATRLSCIAARKRQAVLRALREQQRQEQQAQ
ncbi:hypothetical protein MM1S1540310_3143 [Mycobacteroides abscessus subsp. bolletii 1S-154-0310]|nr:hypothetical protein MM1S1510930_3586 [Mycobacteroides abscessus subsp. bolletii 1S-151-0930]EIU69684.1 hypothetical protein MM1S1520914_3792 [Mycobacteroides abscessus subsp. bolletii 1S-152-0914]EIU73825.1 hypothetical protein MM1S1530915_3136 [Mycobacteroides abscessus subsp. bolletii 1S-153-0915]EIU80669.1 hypothetical protein MM1S1540310_3143 [Mycobacteroides abscessus subsp. bolletii 1S-154-0310]PVA66792.1 hypothetical protein DDJ87_08320 [Mycobacteroides abscessus]